MHITIITEAILYRLGAYYGCTHGFFMHLNTLQ